MTEDELTTEQKEVARAIFMGESERSACHFCAGIHAAVAGLPPSRQPCPRIRKAEWHPDGTVLNVEFWPPGDWEADVIFPDDVFEDDEEDVT